MQKISKSEYTEHWNCYHSKIFKEPWDSYDFANEEWSKILFPYQILLSKKIISKLQKVIVSNDAALAFSVDTIIDDAEIYTLKNVFQNWDDLSQSILAHFNVHIFDESQRWGLIVTTEGVTILGGAKSLLQSFVSEMGGENNLLSDFDSAYKDQDLGEELMNEWKNWRTHFRF